MVTGTAAANRVAYLKQALRGLSGGFRWRQGAGKRTALFRRRWRCRHLNFQLLPADAAGVLVFQRPRPFLVLPLFTNVVEGVFSEVGGGR